MVALPPKFLVRRQWDGTGVAWITRKGRGRNLIQCDFNVARAEIGLLHTLGRGLGGVPARVRCA